MQQRGEDSLEAYANENGSTGIAKKLATNVDSGIKTETADSRRTKFGKNFIPPKKPKTFWELALEAMKDTTLQILIACAVVSILLATYQYVQHHGGESDETAVELQCRARDAEGSVALSKKAVEALGDQEQHWFSKYRALESVGSIFEKKLCLEICKNFGIQSIFLAV